MTDNIIHYLKHDRGFASGLGLYQSLPGANRATIAHLSRTGSSKSTLEHLHYDLAKLAGITQQQFNRIMASPVTPAPKAEVAGHEPANTDAPKSHENPAPEIDFAALKWPAHRSVAARLGITVNGTKKVDYEAAFAVYQAEKKS